MILAGDIGGTKVNLGLFELRDGKLTATGEGTRSSHAFPRLQDLVKEYLDSAGSPTVESACFGVAGPVRDGVVRVTNLPWQVGSAELSAELKIPRVSLINDLEANGYGLAELPPGDLVTLNAGTAGAAGNAAIISAGTGLGEAGLFWDGETHRPFACEGGHGSFAPQTELDAELFAWLRKRHGHVSWERVLSGSGLCNIHAFLQDTGRGEDPADVVEAMAHSDPAAVITEAALAGKGSRCVQALDLFVGYYGAEAGNLALKMMSLGGVYIGGGIAPRILPRLREGKFLASFTDKGRMRPLLEAMPVRVVLNPKTALLGAAHYAAFGPDAGV